LPICCRKQAEVFDEALQLAQQAQHVMSKEPSIADTLGWIYLKKKMPDSAIQIFQNLVDQNPAKAIYRYHLGAALFLKGEKAAGKAELRNALRRSPNEEEEQKIRELLAKS
jgi:predicted Zn-dependent protease